MKRYDSPYYDVHSDLDPERVREAILRMNRMAEEYRDRTRDFSGQIRGKLPFLLFNRPEDYYAAGGMPGSAGVFMNFGQSSMLMAIGGSRSGFTWHVIQHEGFHQFAHHVIGGRLPPWVNEGLAEYFGEGLYTGDGFVTGLLPASRLKRLQAGMAAGQFRPLTQMMAMSHARWNTEMDIANYDQAWSMAHFLAHGESGKYQSAYAAFIKALGNGQSQSRAWEEHFGSTEGFEKKWREWYLSLPTTASRDLYVKACVAALTSFYGRAVAQKQTFDRFADFVNTGRQGKLKIADDDWLPPGLFKFADALTDRVSEEVKLELGRNPSLPQIVAFMKDQTIVTSTYFGRARTPRVVTEIDDLIPTIEQAKRLIAQKRKEEARYLLMDRIRKLPRSPKVDEARKLAQSTFAK